MGMKAAGALARRPAEQLGNLSHRYLNRFYAYPLRIQARHTSGMRDCPRHFAIRSDADKRKAGK